MSYYREPVEVPEEGGDFDILVTIVPYEGGHNRVQPLKVIEGHKDSVFWKM